MALTVESNFKSVKDHIQEVYKDKYVLPEFQRTFVWGIEKVQSLWESLYNGFPIGQLMFWGEVDIDFPVRSLGISQEEVKEPGKADKLIVDGQQRITALWVVLKGEVPLYFDLERTVFSPDRQNENTIRLDILKGRTYDEALNANLFFVNASPNQKDRFSAQLTRLNSMLTNTTVPYQLIANAQYPTVVSIFNRLNQQGVRLTDGQLALATISNHWKGVFRKTFDLMKTVNTEFNYVKNENPDLIIQAWTCAHTGQHLIKNLAPDSQKSKYYKMASQAQYEASWAKLEPAFRRAISLMKEQFDLSNYQFIPGFYPLVVVVNYFANRPEVPESDKRDLCKWFIQSMITGRYATRSTTKFRDDIKATREGKALSELFFHAGAHDPTKFVIQKEAILGAGFKSSFATLLYILMRKSLATDLLDTSTAVGTILPENQSWQFHHIFPDSVLDGKRQEVRNLIEDAENEGTEEDVERLQKQLKALDESITSIPNLAFLMPVSNLTLSASRPLEYLKTILDRPGGRQILESQLIPTDPQLWRVNSFEEFREARAQLILDKTNEYLRKNELI
jgi:hypothetical protein